MNTYTVGLQAT